MNTDLSWLTIGFAAVLAVAGCGGGGGGGGTSSAPPPVTTPVATSLQAKVLAARSANAMFAYDNMNSETQLAALSPLPIGAGLTTASYAVPCASGTGSTAFADADASGTVSAGDATSLTLTACQPTATFAWALTGTVRVAIVSGTNIEQHLYNVAPGSAVVRATHAGTALGGSRTATGIYTLATSIAAVGAAFDQVVSMGDFTIAHPTVNLHITGLSFTVAGGSLAVAAGTFDTSVSGIGAVQLALSVKSPLTIDASTTRFRPTAGTLTVTASNFSLDIQYGAGGTVTIRVDNGRDGTVDMTVSTTETELDSLLTVP